MAWRDYPELSAYEEGQQKAETNIDTLQGGYAMMGYSSVNEAIQNYGERAYELLEQLESTNGDPEHIELLHGYLSRFD